VPEVFLCVGAGVRGVLRGVVGIGTVVDCLASGAEEGEDEGSGEDVARAAWGCEM